MAKRGSGGYDNPLVEPGDNTKFLSHALMVQAMPPIDYNDPEKVRQRIKEYFALCMQNDMKPSVQGFCMALKIARSTLWAWKTGTYRKGTHEEIIVQAFNTLEALWEDYMQNGKINPMAGVFLGINNYGYKDVKQVSVNPVVIEDRKTVDVAAIEAKYADLPQIEGETE